MIFLGLDLGASACKALLMQADGAVLATGRVAINTHTRAKQAEQNPQDWCVAMQKAIADLFKDSPHRPDEITAISITAGTHICVLTDADFAPLRAAILWSDQRATDEVAELEAHRADIIATSLHCPNATWTLAHLRWLCKHEPHVVAQVKHILPAKDWLRHQLTGDYLTDLSDAIGTQLMDIATQNWSPGLCALAGITADLLPPIQPATNPAGKVTQIAANRFGLAADTPVYIGAIDTSTELLAAGLSKPGEAAIKLASAGVVSLCYAQAQACPPVSCYPQAQTGWYFAAGMNTCTNALDWARRELLNDMTFAAMEQLAKQSPIGARGVIFHPYLLGERAPHWNGDLRACLSGLTLNTSQADIARAIYEGIALALYDVRLDLAQQTGQDVTHFALLGGGAESMFWGQMMADIQGVAAYVPPHTDAAYGAALCAAMAHDMHQGTQEKNQTDRADWTDWTERTKQTKMHYTPNANAHATYQDIFAQYQKMYKKIIE